MQYAYTIDNHKHLLLLLLLCSVYHSSATAIAHCQLQKAAYALICTVHNLKASMFHYYVNRDYCPITQSALVISTRDSTAVITNTNVKL
jgi:hypothetical protein